MPARSPTPSPSPSAKLRGQIWYTTAVFHHGSPASVAGAAPAASAAVAGACASSLPVRVDMGLLLVGRGRRARNGYRPPRVRAVRPPAGGGRPHRRGAGGAPPGTRPPAGPDPPAPGAAG